MGRLPVNATALARELVQYEAAGASDSAAAAAAVDTACRILRDYLKDLLGSAGVVALMRRALNLAKREHPLLAEVTLSSEATACFTGLSEALAAGSGEDSATAGISILAHFLGLLILILGEDLGTQPVRKLWPHLVSSVTETDE